ncbi:MAG: molybdopterin-dependent oxidoreductase [Flavobacteriaceae bacterium]
MVSVPEPEQTVCTTCPYCGVGCGVLATRETNGGITIAGDPNHPANFGRLCSKGSALGETVSLEGRLLYPEVDGRRVGWEAALGLIADTFRETMSEYGPESVAFYVSGQLLTEDYYVANKLMKGFIGTANIDTNSRLCMASSVAGHRRAFGSDTVPGNYEDLEQADLLVLTGSNLAWCHPVLYQRIAAAKEARPQMRVVLIDPRRTMTADIADMHLPIGPDGDVALFSGLLAHLIRGGHVDRIYTERHVSGLAEAGAAALALPMEAIVEATGLEARQIEEFYQWFAARERVVTVYSQGVNQSASGTDKVNAIINCHLATGRIGRPGTGPFSITGQPNAMGGREVGGLANMLAAHMEIENADHRALVQGFWRSPTIAAKPGLKAVDMFRAVADGRIKALWIMATNPVDSLPDADAVKAAIASCPFVVVSDVADDTDTLALAHVKLPAAAWAEKDGTVTNSERRISRQRAVLPLPGEARPDWWIIAGVGRHMGFEAQFAWNSAAEVFAEYAALSAFGNEGSRDFDIGALAGISRRRYDALKPFQWPLPAEATEGRARFFANGGFYTKDGKARMIALSPPQRRRASAAYPLTLNTGRVRDHWHTMTRTGKSARLSAHMAEPFAEIHPETALRHGIAPASILVLESEYGSVLLRALVTARVAPDQVFVPMHWNDQFASKARIDTLVAPVTDPHSGQPALKNVAVRAAPFAAALYGFAVMREKPSAIPADYWALARTSGGWRVELAFAQAPGDITAFAHALLGAGDTTEPVSYIDGPRRDARFALFNRGRLQGALFLAPTPVAVSRNAVISSLEEEFAVAGRFRAVAGRTGADRPDPGAILCSCFSVGVNDIARALESGACASVEDIGKALKAGTNCGSCRAEIREIIHARHPVAAE